ncbi:histidine kinase-, DNA gyrase B-, and HSP90-like ATPase family protein [Francisella sp. TX07-6608]|nr:histidine kinase-, DNA gyrase B-, and HSP90-like ATPase family protein [Francisella sp. TX07-6608]
MLNKYKNNKKILSLAISVILILITVFNLVFLYISYAYYLNTQIYRSINIITDLSYNFYDDLVDNKYNNSKFNTIYSIDKSSAEITYTISSKPKSNLFINLFNNKANHELQRKKIEKYTGNKDILKDISICYPKYDRCFNIHIKSRAKLYLYYISLLLSTIISIFFPLYIIYSQSLLFSLIRFKKILTMVDSEIKDFSLFAPKNIQLIPKTIFKIILSLKKEIRNRVFSLNAISHDLKTPLTKAKLLIENKYSDNSLILKYFDDIEYLFSQISTYNKKCNKKVEATKTDIVNFVECLCEDYEVDDCVNFSSSIEEGIVYIQIKEMKRAFSNIINNSIKYAGCVDIFISRKENFIEVTFTDTGPGIKETDLNKIWQPFFRSDVARNSDIPGTGLGLCIVKKIFEANNVQVFIENNKPHGLKVTTKFKDQA